MFLKVDAHNTTESEAVFELNTEEQEQVQEVRKRLMIQAAN